MLKKVIIPIFLAALLGTVIYFTVKPEDAAQVSDPSTFARGLAYLRELEATDPAPVEELLKEYHQQELREEREARMAELENGEIAIWSLFEDYVLLGDSRVMGFDFYGYLDSSRVMAEKGDTILTLESHIPEIVALNPSYVFISYGVNDVGSGMWASPEEYAADFAEIIRSIQDHLPNARIFVNSILPACDPAFNTSSAWYDIPEYNTALEEMCITSGCFFIDNTPICETYAALYEADGIHVTAPFYSHWAANMILRVYDSEATVHGTE